MIIDLREAVHEIFLEAKRLRHFVYSTKFERALSKANAEQLAKIDEQLKKGDFNGIQALVLSLLDEELETSSITRLRLIGRQYAVKAYYNLTKEQLIKEIRNAKKRDPSNPA